MQMAHYYDEVRGRRCAHIAVTLLMLLYHLHNGTTAGTMCAYDRSLLLITTVLTRNPFPINRALIKSKYFFSFLPSKDNHTD